MSPYLSPAEYLPHDAPMLLLDEVEWVSEDYGLAIVGDSAFFQRIQGENPLSDVLSHIRSNPHACALVEA